MLRVSRLYPHFMSAILLLWLFLPFGVFAAQEPKLLLARPHFHDGASYRQAFFNLDRSCVVLSSTRASLPCNPAMLKKSQNQSGFAANLYLGNDFDTVDEIDKIVDGQIGFDEAIRLIRTRQVLVMEGNAELVYKGKSFGFALLPYHLSYYSRLQNIAYPEIALFASREQSATVQIATDLTREVFAGLQLRARRLHFVSDQFFLYDAMLSSQDILQSKTQEAFFVEPGIAYVIDQSWRPTLSAVIKNVGYQDKKYEGIKTDPLLHAGFGFTPNLEFGLLEMGFGFELKDNGRGKINENWYRPQFGAAYQLGLMETHLAFDSDNWAVGVSSTFWSMRVGLVYRQEEVKSETQQTQRFDSITTEFGVEF